MAKSSFALLALLALLPWRGGAAADGGLKIFDQVGEFAAALGPGQVSLLGPSAASMRTVGSKFSTGDEGPFLLLDGNGRDWMTFIGAYDAQWNSLTVRKFLDSSTGAPLALSGATHTVASAWVAPLAQAAANPAANWQALSGGGAVNLGYDNSTGSLGIGTAPAPARLAVSQGAGQRGVVIENNGVADSPLTIYGSPRGDGHKYMTMFGGLGNPGMLTNGWVTINGASGDPVPLGIAGEHIYMLGINSDVGYAPTVVVQSAAGPLLRGYDGRASAKSFELGHGGDAYFAGNVGIRTSGPPSPLAVAGGASVGAAYARLAAPADGLAVQGRVGIGSSAPAKKLVVQEAAANGKVVPTVRLVQGGAGAGTGTAIEFGYADSDAAVARIAGFYDGQGRALSFSTKNDTATAVAERMRIDGAGRVGVGAATPAAQLHVNAASPATVGAVVRAAPSQTADLFQAQGSSGAVLGRIDRLGNLSAPRLSAKQGFSNAGKVVAAGGGAAYAYPAGKSYVYLSANSARIALTFPAPAGDGQVIAFAFGAAVAGATYIPAAPATKIVGAAASLAANSPQHFIYDAATKAWYPY